MCVASWCMRRQVASWSSTRGSSATGDTSARKREPRTRSSARAARAGTWYRSLSTQDALENDDARVRFPDTDMRARRAVLRERAATTCWDPPGRNGTRGTKIAIMNTARPRNAPRKRVTLGALVVALSIGTAHAGGQPQLTLPVVVALALGGSAAGLMGVAATPGKRPGGVLGFLPKQLSIPDGYAPDVYRSTPRFAEAVDRDHLVAFDLVGTGGRGFNLSLSYDEETWGPLHASDELMRFVVEYRF
jgi:hypothetical protein